MEEYSTVKKREHNWLEQQRLNYYSLAYRAHLNGDGAKRDEYRAAAKKIEEHLHGLPTVKAN